jgi:pimeloyl-ACP methyl ester carboxylesterase
MLASDVVRCCDALALEEVALVGHDWGGLIAFKAAIDNPGRFTRLAVIDAPCTVLTPAIPHPWFKAAPLPEAFLAAHGEDFIRVRMGGQDASVPGGRPGTPMPFRRARGLRQQGSATRTSSTTSSRSTWSPGTRRFSTTGTRCGCTGDP